MSDFQIVNGWLTEQAGEHTCGTVDGGYYGTHEPGCGTVPLVRLRSLDGWADLEAEIKADALREAGDALDALQTREHGVPADIRRDPALWLHTRADRLDPRKGTT